MRADPVVDGPDRTARKQRGRPFEPGRSGNPAGRPKGIRNRATLAAEALLDGEAEALTRRAVELAFEGDSTALRLCMERLLPARRDRPVSFALPKVETAGDAVQASVALVRAVAAGELTPVEAAEIAKLIETVIKAIEVHDLEERLSRLEAVQS